MEKEPWEALDVDHSDLSTFLRPCNRLPSTSKTLIPGPAGTIQAAMMHRDRRDSLPTQEFVRHVFLNGHQNDRDFTSNPWLCALQFIPPQEMLDEDGVKSPSGTPLSSIEKHLEVGKMPQVIAIIKSCTPNGFGDMMVTLKDPTRTVDASVHHKVFAEGQFGKDITVGSAVVLQKVAVFSPIRSSCYLNITLRNIVKIFPKDCGPPSQQIYPTCSVPSIAERHEKSWMPGSTLSLTQERTQGIMTSLRVDSRLIEVAHTGKEKGEFSISTSCHSDNGKEQNPKSDMDRENLLLTQDDARPLEVVSGGEFEGEMKDQTNPPKLGEGDNLTRIDQGSSSSENPVQISDDQETGIKNKRQKQMENLKNPMPHWTDEQLDELLAFD